MYHGITLTWLQLLSRLLFACTLMLPAIFLKFLRKLSHKTIYLLYSTFIKLIERFIKVLAAILVLEVLQVSLRSSSLVGTA